MAIQLNPSVTDGYEAKTLAEIRQKILDVLTISPPLTKISAQRTLGAIRAMVMQRLGVIVDASEKYDTLANLRAQVYAACGFAAMATHPPGVDAIINRFIDQAHRTAFMRIELDRAQLGIGTAGITQPDPMTLDTDTTKVNAIIVLTLAIGLTKGYYEQADSQLYLQQSEKLIADTAQRWPPNIIGNINAAIIDAHQTIFRRWEFEVDDLPDETFGIGLWGVAAGGNANTLRGYMQVSDKYDNDKTNIDGHLVSLLATANMKKKIGQPDADVIHEQYEHTLADMMKRSPSGCLRCINEAIRTAQDLLYRQYDVFRMERWYTWTMKAGQRFYGINGDDNSLSNAPTGLVATQGTAVVSHNLAVAREAPGYALLPSGKVLITGGLGIGYGLLTSSELYDETTGIFTPTGASPQNILGPDTMVTLPDGRVFAADNTMYTQHTELYSEQSGAWTAGPLMTVGRSSASATLLTDGTVLIVGGWIAGPDLTTAVAEIYDPIAGTITAVGSLATKRQGHTATLLPDGRVLIAGGHTDTFVRLKSAEVYNPATKQFTSVGNMSVERDEFTATLLTNGSVLLVGGFQPIAQSSAELFDPRTNTFSITGPLPAARGGHQAVLLNDETVLIFGGNFGGTYYTSTAIYNQLAATFTAGPVAAHAQNFGVAIKMHSGKVLGAGGTFDNTETAQKLAMIYDPAGPTFSATGSLTQGTTYYKVTALTDTGESTPSAEAFASGIPANTAVNLSWVIPANQPFVRWWKIYRGKTSGTEGYIDLVPSWQNTYTDLGTSPPGAAPPTSNTAVGPGQLDPRKVHWVGVSWNDTGWRALVKKVPPENYLTTNTGIPHFYDIRQAIEVWPAAAVDNQWFLRIKGQFGCADFNEDDDRTSMDWQAVYYKALALASETLDKKNAPARHERANWYVGQLVAGTHGTKRYFPGVKTDDMRPLTPPVDVP